MILNNMYRYLGVNGIITTPIKIDGVYSVELIQVVADKDKILRNSKTGEERLSVIIPKEEVSDWTEYDKMII